MLFQKGLTALLWWGAFNDKQYCMAFWNWNWKPCISAGWKTGESFGAWMCEALLNFYKVCNTLDRILLHKMRQLVKWAHPLRPQVNLSLCSCLTDMKSTLLVSFTTWKVSYQMLKMCLLDLGDINDIIDLDQHVNLVILSESGSN